MRDVEDFPDVVSQRVRVGLSSDVATTESLSRQGATNATINAGWPPPLTLPTRIQHTEAAPSAFAAPHPLKMEKFW